MKAYMVKVRVGEMAFKGQAGYVLEVEVSHM